MIKLHFLYLLSLIILTDVYAKNIVIAHRGASGYLPEHTLEGAAMAHSWDVDFIEPDLVMSKDNHLVILHDTHLDTTTDVAERFPKRKRKDGRYYAIDFTLKEIKTLRVHERRKLKTGKNYFPKRFSAGKSKFEVPTFVEFIELVQGLNKTRNKDIGIYPEMKSPEFHLKEGKDIAKATLNILTKYGYNKKDANIFLQCFYPPTLKRLREKLGAKMPLVLLIADPSWEESSADYRKLLTKKGLNEVSGYIDGIGPWINQLYTVKFGQIKKTNLVKWAKELNLKIHTYTHRLDSLPKGFKSSKQLLDFLFNELGVDGVFSDFADTVRH